MSLSTLPTEIISLNTLSKQDEIAPGMLHLGTDLEPRLRLFLSNNLFTRLPSSILELRNLRFLSLRNNNLTSIPAGIRDLVNLESLNVAGNQLSELPFEILDLVSRARLRELTVQPNPWRHRPRFSEGNERLSPVTWIRNGSLMITKVITPDVQPPHSTLPPSKKSTIPSLTELILRQLRKIDPRSEVDFSGYMPPDSPQNVLENLTFLKEHPDDRCASCQRSIALEADEQIEWWYIASDHFLHESGDLSPSATVPFRKLLCWHSCQQMDGGCVVDNATSTEQRSANKAV